MNGELEAPLGLVAAVDSDTVTLTGELDAATSEVARQAFEEALARVGTADVVVDVAGLTFCDSSGLREFAVLARGLAPDRRVVVRRPSDALRRVLTITGLDRVLVMEG